MDAKPNTEQPSKIFLNPMFAKAHINPKFLATNGTLRRPETQSTEAPEVLLQSKIHFNPAFLGKLQIQQVSNEPPASAATLTSRSQHVNPLISVAKPCIVVQKHTMPVIVNPIIKNTRRKLVRANATNNTQVAVMVKKAKSANAIPVSTPLAPLVRIGKNKLIRGSMPSLLGLENVKTKITGKLPERKSLRIDRRIPSSSVLARKPTFVKRYALSRINGFNPKKVIITDPKLLKLKRKPATRTNEKAGNIKNPVAYASKNKQLVLVNINGVLYRSSTNKLQKSVPQSARQTVNPSPTKVARKTKERFLIIRGMRYALDHSGLKLRTVGAGTAATLSSVSSKNSSESKLNRIDIGGLTYKARNDGTFIRTDNHRTRNHLSTAKQRSIQVLTSKLKKCNEPCHIYRRLGKCLAYQRGKCPKLHDPKHVSICQKFLRGECILDGCLLSHDVSLEKMPVCKFFLEGRCMHDVCPYLHKKVSESVRICDAFVNGFCPLADKCPNRHVFQCPEYERQGKCDRVKCPYPHGSKEIKRKQSIAPPSSGTSSQKKQLKDPSASVEASTLPIRYYRDDGLSTTDRDQTGELSASERNQLTRMLGEVDKMKQRQKDGDDQRDNNKDDVPIKPINDEDAVVSIDQRSEDDRSETSDEATPEEAMNSENEEDMRPPVMRRKALGILPAFIPI
ncbi:zinc finger CCCH domain-containing protein 3 [Anopheles nili]|uniref:zinc finger CCCH domain-containing protein 3 n=1 Tax=Anopheles nili TaxID=185578 RepID=UPI00237AE50A|nr:zinc finger CCCH domain-containing protein 3 [Anopheles nili]